MSSFFSFAAATNVPTSALITSNTVTPSGLTGAVAITIVGGSYSINGGAFTSAPGVLNPGDTLALRGTSSSALSTQTSVDVTIDGVTSSFYITTTSSTERLRIYDPTLTNRRVYGPNPEDTRIYQ